MLLSYLFPEESTDPTVPFAHIFQNFQLSTQEPKALHIDKLHLPTYPSTNSLIHFASLNPTYTTPLNVTTEAFANNFYRNICHFSVLHVKSITVWLTVVLLQMPCKTMMGVALAAVATFCGRSLFC